MSTAIDYCSALFAQTSSAILVCDREGEKIEVNSRSDLERALDRGAISVSLSAADDGIVGVHFKFLSQEEARAALDRFGHPSILLIKEDGDERVLIYILDEVISRFDPRSDVFHQIVNSSGGSVQFVPLAGVDGWVYGNEESETAASTGEVCVFSFGELVAKCQAPAPIEVPQAAIHPPARTTAPVPETLPEGVSRVGDAYVHGDLDADTLEKRQVTLAFAKGHEARRWPNTSMTLLSLVKLLLPHEVGEKDGKCFLTGETIESKRLKTSIRAMYVAGIDVDSGVSLEAVIERLKDLRLFAVLYTTHSHLKTETTVSQTSFAGWCRKQRIEPDVNDGAVRDFLVKVRAYTPAIADTCTVRNTRHSPRGIEIIVTHAPMPKFRIILPLAEPFVFAEQKGSHQDALKRWGRMLRGLSHLLSVPIDEACLDPSRLFYLPRHAKGSAHETHVICGQLTDITQIQEAAAGLTVDGDPFTAAGAELGRGMSLAYVNDRFTRSGMDVALFVRERANYLELGQLIRDNAPEQILHDAGTKLSVCCPFDGEHSNPGDSNDRGTFVSNASDNPQQTGCVFFCSHNACHNRSKSHFLCKAIELGWFSEQDLENQDYYIEIFEKPKGSSEASSTVSIYQGSSVSEIIERASRLSADSSSSEIGSLLQAAVSGKLSALEMADIYNIVKVKTGRQIGSLRETTKEIERNTRREKKKGPNTGMLEMAPPIRAGMPVRPILTSEHGFSWICETVKNTLMANNRNNPLVFRNSGELCRISYDENLDEVSVRKTSNDYLSVLLAENISFQNFIDDGTAIEVHPPREVVSNVAADPGVEFPPLLGAKTMPFFAKDGQLVTEPGYHRASGIYYQPSNSMRKLSLNYHPTECEIRDAINFHNENLWSDFPFDDGKDTSDVLNGQSSRAHLWALIFQFFVRSMIDGPTPIYLLSKPAPGTGAGLMMEVALYTATGSSAQAQSPSASDEEMRKLITTKLLASTSYIWFDNLSKKMDSGALASAITSTVWTDRMLGSNHDIRVPNRAAYIIAGNNPILSPELVRRSVPIRIDVKGDPLSRRAPFKHKDLVKWTKDNRVLLVESILAAIQYWINRGMPKYDGKLLPSFEEWSMVIGGILQCVGIPGFLGNLQLLTEQTDDQNAAINALLQHWFNRGDYNQPRPVGNVEGSGKSFDGENSLVHIILENGLDIELRGYDGTQKAKQLTRILTALKDNVFKLEDNGQPCQVALRRETHRSTKSAGFSLEIVN